jgi:phage terminase large subunit-like protein
MTQNKTPRRSRKRKLGALALADSYAHEAIVGTRFNRRIKALSRQWLEWRAAPPSVGYVWDEERLAELVAYARDRFGIELLPWQYLAFGLLVAWRDSTDMPMVRVFVIQVARGAGKSEMVAILSAWLLERNARLGQKPIEVVVLATQMDRAKDVWSRQEKCLGTDPSWKFVGGLSSVSVAVASHAGGICRCKPSTPKNADGILPTLIVLDEAARIEDATYDRALSALSKVPGSQALIVTTPDKDQRRRSYGTTVGILERAYDDGEAAPAGIVGMIFGIDSTDDAEDEECWYKAQPGLGITKSIADYRFQKIMLLDPGTPNGRDEFWTQQLATFTDDLAGALPLSLYDACVEDWNLEDYRGLPAVIGVDFSQGGWSEHQTDLTSICVLVWDGLMIRSRSYHYWAGVNIAAEEKKCKQPLRAWRDEGLLEVCGDTIDYSLLEARVMAIASIVDLRHWVADPCGKAPAWCDAMEKRHGWRWSRASQNHIYMGSAWAVWADAVRGRRIRFNTDPVLRMSIGHTIAKVTDRGLAVPSKGASRSNIDPVTACCMAIKVMNDHELMRESLYGDPSRIAF